MTDIRRIEAGARMSEAVIHGNKVYTAGIVADKTIGKSVLEQTKEILEQIDAAVHEPRHGAVRAGPPVAVGFRRFVRRQRQWCLLLDQ